VISFEISQIKESIVSLANSKDANDNYLFAGYRSGTQPFVSNQSGEVEFFGDRGVHSVQISETLRANAGLDGAAVFMRVDTDEAAKPFFDILTSMERELQGGALNDDIIAELNASIDHFSIAQARVGAELNKLDNQKVLTERRILLMDENLSNLEDADLAALVTELQSKIVSRDAAQQSFVQIGQQSLFDYIR
jgi:flagellar hook-associated protein 3 FlgL